MTRLLPSSFFLLSLVSASVAGCLDSPLPNRGDSTPFVPPPLGEPKEWDFAGYNGRVDLRVENLTWIHVAFPVTPSLKDGEVNLTLRWNYGSPANTPIFDLTYFGFSMDGRWVGDAAGPRFLQAGSSDRSNNREYYAHVEAPGLKRETSGPNPLYGALDDYGTAVFGKSRAEGWLKIGCCWPYEDLRKTYGLERPVVHIVAVEGGGQLVAPVTIQGHWSNTPLNFTYGTSEDADAFAYFQEDFTSDVGADLTAYAYGPHLANRATLSTELAREGRPTIFAYFPQSYLVWYSPNALPETWTGASYTRPNQTREAFEFFSLEITHQRGSWTFDHGAKVGILGGSFPILFGTAFEPARMFWDTPTRTAHS